MSNIDRAVNALLALNQSVRSDHLYEIVHRYNYAYEFATINVNAGRMTGKSAYVLAHATDNDLVLVHSKDALRWFKEVNGLKNVFTLRSFLIWCRGRSPEQKQFDKIYVDEPRFILEKVEDQEALWDQTVHKDVTYILLGAH